MHKWLVRNEMRFFQAGAKAKAALAKRNVEQTRPIEVASDNDSIVALGVYPRNRLDRDWRVADKAKQGKHLCEHCAWRPPSAELLHAHHVIPLSCGGQDHIDNLIIL